MQLGAQAARTPGGKPGAPTARVAMHQKRSDTPSASQTLRCVSSRTHWFLHVGATWSSLRSAYPRRWLGPRGARAIDSFWEFKLPGQVAGGKGWGCGWRSEMT